MPVCAILEIIEPNVSVQREGKENFKPAKEGQKLRVGDSVQTDETGFAQIVARLWDVAPNNTQSLVSHGFYRPGIGTCDATGTCLVTCTAAGTCDDAILCPPGIPICRCGWSPRVRDVRVTEDELTFKLGSGIEHRLGDGSDLALKLAIAARINRPCHGVSSRSNENASWN